MIFSKMKMIIENPEIRFSYFSALGLYNYVDDEKFLKKKYYLRTGKKLDLDSPRTFNEKMQWLKLHDRKDIYTTMVDKFEAKKYVANIIGEEYIIPTIGVYNKFDEIDFNKLPNQFVIKCTHDSGGLIICKDKAIFDINEAKKKINKCLRRNYYYSGREWPYRNVEPRIIIEKYMSDIDSCSAIDYKFFCFNGKPEIVLACSDRFCDSGLKETWFDSEWNLLPVTEGGHNIDNSIKKPKRFNKMKSLACKLSKDIAFVRVDFYEFGGKAYFGEITFFPASGFEKFNPEKWNKKLGDMIDLGLVKED